MSSFVLYPGFLFFDFAAADVFVPDEEKEEGTAFELKLEDLLVQ